MSPQSCHGSSKITLVTENSSGHWHQTIIPEKYKKCLSRRMHPVLQVQAAPAVIIPVVTTVFHVSWWWRLPISPSWNVFSWSVLFGSNVTLYDSWGVCRRGTSFTDSLSQDLLHLFQTLGLSNQLQLHLKGRWNINLLFGYSAKKNSLNWYISVWPISFIQNF